jgi:Uma2 family endonuclease
MSVLALTPPERLVDARQRPYFLWDSDMTVDEFRARLRDPDPEVRAYFAGKLMRQAKPNDAFAFMTLDEIVRQLPAIARYLGSTYDFWIWLLSKWDACVQRWAFAAARAHQCNGDSGRNAAPPPTIADVLERPWQALDMGAPPASRFSAKEYLALEVVADTKHEFFGGYIVAMAGAEPEHNQVAENVRAELRTFGDRPCRILGSDQRLLVESVGEYFYPDIVVTCSDPTFVDPKPRSLVNPELIVEVLSETTSRYDHHEKWQTYRSIATLTDYVMVASTKRELEHYHRLPDGSWTLRVLQGTGTTTLGNGAVLDLAKLYRLVPGLG